MEYERCNGRVNPEGHLMKFDLEPFSKFRIPARIERYLKDENRKESVILYMFFTINEDNRVEPFGWVVTSKKYKLIDMCPTVAKGKHFMKRINALNEVIRYITD